MKNLDAKSVLVGALLAILGLLAMGQRSPVAEAGRFQATAAHDAGGGVFVLDTATGVAKRFDAVPHPGLDFDTQVRMRGR